MNKNIELAKKLKALSDRGIGGEKVNAQKLLDDLLKKHNLSIEDIENEKIDDYYFSPKEKDEQLLYQITKRVNSEIKCYKIPQKKVKEYALKGNFIISCTLSESIEIEAMFDIYKKHLEKELEIFWYAFCKANNLLIQTNEKREFSSLSSEEVENITRSYAMANNIKAETYRKQLADKNK
jgi:hypothetical protein